MANVWEKLEQERTGDPTETVASPVHQSPWEQLAQERSESQNLKDEPAPLADLNIEPFSDPEGKFARKVLKELLPAVGRGISTGFTEMAESGIEGIETISQMGVGPLRATARLATTTGLTESAKKAVNQLQEGALDFFGDIETFPAEVVEVMAQFLGPGAPIAKLAKVKGAMQAAMLGGAVGATAFDVYDKRLSDLIVDLDIPGLSKVVDDYMVPDEDTPEVLAHAQRFIEDTALGAAAGKLMDVMISAKAARKVKQQHNDIKEQFTSGPSPGDLRTRLEDALREGKAVRASDGTTKELREGTITIRDLQRMLPIEERLGAPELLEVEMRLAQGNTNVKSIVVEMVDGKPSKILLNSDIADLAQTIAQSSKDQIKVKMLDHTAQDSILEASKAVEDVFAKTVARERKVNETVMGSLRRFSNNSRDWLDVSGPMRKNLLKEGEVGRRAMEKHVLSSGGSSKATLDYQDKIGDIFEGLDVEQADLWNQVTTGSRYLDVASRNPTLRPVEGLGAKEWEGRLAHIRQTVGDEQYKMLQQKSQQFFDAVDENFLLMKDHGLLNDEGVDHLRKQWTFGDPEFMETIDPLIKRGDKDVAFRPPGAKAPRFATSSGLPKITRRRMKQVSFDNPHMLHQIMMRTRARILRNDGAIEMEKIPQLHPDSPYVFGKANSSFDVPISAYKDGVETQVFMPKWMAEQWYFAAPEVSRFYSNVARTLSGSMFVRPLATGYNPAFALGNFPREVWHAYWAAPKEVGFSAMPLKFGAQFSRDLAVTFKDAWKKEGLFNDLADHGFIQDFLTHQGKSSFIDQVTDVPLRSGSREGTLRGKIFDRNRNPFATAAEKEWWIKSKRAMSKLNEFSEIWPRMAVANQTLRNGGDIVDAAYQARALADFAQAGLMMRRIDNVVPYANAVVQTVRPTLREAKRDPKRFMAKLGWINAMSFVWTAQNYMRNPEVMQTIPDADKLTKSVMVMPDWFATEDQVSKETTPAHFSFRGDEFGNLMSSMGTMLAVAAFEKRVPDESAFDVVKDMVGIVPGAKGTVPSVDAMLAYFLDIDMWKTGDLAQVWRNPRYPAGHIPRDMERILPTQGAMPATPLLARQTADLVNPVLGDTVFAASPERLDAALRRVVPNNPFVHWAHEFLWERPIEGQSEFEKRQDWMSTIARDPVISRVLSIANPIRKEMLSLRYYRKQGNATEMKEVNAYQAQWAKLERGAITQSDMKTWIKSQPPDWQEMHSNALRGDLVYTQKITKAQRGDKLKGTGVTRSWFRFVNSLNSRLQGQQVFEKARNMNKKQRGEFLKQSEIVLGGAHVRWYRNYISKYDLD